MEMLEEVKAKMRVKGIFHPTYSEIFEYAMRRALKMPDVRRSIPSSGEVPEALAAAAAPPPHEAPPAQRTAPSLDEVRKAPPPSTSESNTASASIPIPRAHRPHIPASTIRKLKAEAGSQCTYRSALNGKRCQERHGLQIEHCNPYAMGGGDEIENLTLLCPTHNRLRAIEQFGFIKVRHTQRE
jgi:hypothetical protein